MPASAASATMPRPANAKKKRGFMFGSLLMCCLSASLLATSFATEYWFVSDSKWFQGESVIGNGAVYFGLFSGMNEFLDTTSNRIHTLYVVCLDGDCMYSCATTKETREEQLQMLLDGETVGLKVNCPRGQDSNARSPLTMLHSLPGQTKGAVESPGQTHLLNPLYPAPLSPDSAGVKAEGIEHMPPEPLYDPRATETTSEAPTSDDLEFMDYGLWVGTIACLSAGLLMAVVGALFAVVNTATTPVEAITGVPGLYLWNALAAIFDMITVILWAVQFHKHLSSNVLLYDSSDGWTTEGMEVFGYSFWLVVVAIFVHVANIAIIAIGTYEPKKKTQLEAPDSKGGNIMLY